MQTLRYVWSAVSVRLVLSLAILLVFHSAVFARGEGSRIYRSYVVGEQLPIYTDKPLNESSYLVAFFAFPAMRHRDGITADSKSPMRARRTAVEPMVQRAANKYGVDPALVKAVIEVESGFNSQALSSKGAAGLMQVMPATAARYGRFDLYSPEQNIDVGTQYLRDLLTKFGGNVQLAVAAYNAGENAVIRNGWKVPPFSETIKYVPIVLERYRRYQRIAQREID